MVVTLFDPLVVCWWRDVDSYEFMGDLKASSTVMGVRSSGLAGPSSGAVFDQRWIVQGDSDGCSLP